jgi:TatD DNase family protein
MQFVDTHAHLTHGRLVQQTAAVLERAHQAEVSAVLLAAGNLHDSRLAVNLARKPVEETAGVVLLAMVGVHPHDAQDAPGGYLDQLADLAGFDVAVAIGEIGLDYHYDFSPREVQRRVFNEQLDLAGRLGCPVVLHTREAFEDTLACLREADVPGQKLVFHSFTGPPEQTRAVLDLGAAVSFSGIATFKRADDLRRSAALVPGDRLLIETDSPYLSPEPVRERKTNEPANVVHVARCLAEVRNQPLAELAEQTTRNAGRLLNVPVAGA